MAALLALVLVVAVIVAMERTDRRVRAQHRLPEISDRDTERTRADLAAQSPVTPAGATHVETPRTVRPQLRPAAFR